MSVDCLVFECQLIALYLNVSGLPCIWMSVDCLVFKCQWIALYLNVSWLPCIWMSVDCLVFECMLPCTEMSVNCHVFQSQSDTMYLNVKPLLCISMLGACYLVFEVLEARPHHVDDLQHLYMKVENKQVSPHVDGPAQVCAGGACAHVSTGTYLVGTKPTFPEASSWFQPHLHV